jgi:hypothetical protein
VKIIYLSKVMAMSMSANDQYVKFQSNQAGPFTSDNNIVDVTIPGGAAYNLRDSYLQVYTSIATTETAGSTGVHMCQLAFSGSTQNFPNSCLVENASVECSARGQIESIRRCDILSQAKQLVARSQRETQTYDRLSCNTAVDPNGNVRSSVFLNEIKQGTVVSTQREVPIPIRLGDVMESMNTSMYDGRVLGDLRLRFELNAPGGGSPRIVGQEMLPVATTQWDWLQCQDVPAASGGVNTLTVKVGAGLKSVPTIADYGYYVGQKILVTATAAGGAGPVAGNQTNLVITNITWSNAGTLVITLSADWCSTAAGQTYTNVVVSGFVQAATITPTFNRCELVVKRIGNPPPVSMAKKWTWRSYSTTQDVGPVGITAMNRQYTLPAEADAALITFPQTALLPFSINQDISSYRLSVNQVQMTDRDVGVTVAATSPLAYDRLTAVMTKIGVPTRNLLLRGADSAALTYALSYPQATEQVMFGTAMPFTENSKQLSLKINLTANQVGQLAIFASIPRSIEY